MKHKIKHIPTKHQLGFFGFLMITASMVVSIYAYPTFATSGFSTIFFLMAAGIFWFIPVCLIAAELGTGGQGWCDAGVFSWGKAAFGARWGFFMIFLQWAQVSLGFIAMLYFIANGIAYAFDYPILAKPSISQLIILLIIFWLITLANFFGTKITKLIASYAFFIGILFPIIILIILGISYFSSGNKIEISFSINTFFPNFSNFTALVVLVSFILSYMGPEASAVHVNHLKNPAKNYPLAIITLVLLTIILAALSAITIAMVVPLQDISLSGGIFEAFLFLFKYYGVSWIIYPFSLLITLSAVGEISSWINGPIRGIQHAAQDGLLPPFFAKTNQHLMPIRLLVFQAIIVSIWLIVLTLAGMAFGSGNMAFFTAMTLTVITYLTMYIILFLAYCYLKIKVPNTINPRKFNLPHKLGLIIAVMGLVFTLLAFFISFSRPSSVAADIYDGYLAALIICYLALIITPHIIFSLIYKHQYHWQKFIKDNRIGLYHEKE
ncbi:amino acid permease [Facilibium subflavum]|uniref:amino acid permease n=1 Tax=Facilibium subflavum TaxID=2219058 RepID=UPI000E65DC60|nr:amino acid permease [Facilibium subflavum]